MCAIAIQCVSFMWICFGWMLRWRLITGLDTLLQSRHIILHNSSMKTNIKFHISNNNNNHGKNISTGAERSDFFLILYKKMTKPVIWCRPWQFVLDTSTYICVAVPLLVFHVADLMPDDACVVALTVLGYDDQYATPLWSIVPVYWIQLPWDRCKLAIHPSTVAVPDLLSCVLTAK